MTHRPETAKQAWADAWKNMTLELRCRTCGQPYKGVVTQPCPKCTPKSPPGKAR